ncbi:MAG: hypothetical protein WC910_06345 [Bacteroidales bacterium]|jgi:hypothetical protein|nr:hypothetical protein [Bacteroidales bacterium]NLB79945.1 hypothetical protein [Clostridiaceae bacterium]OQC56942.1 MAG: hypothetical protein BWX52_01369 [Bacteroidetes bacterium ADurb.Bin013]HPA49889.1 hypothetical protein [Methanofastidiosum sp.]HPM11275.1 hypothetical protein [Paludibacter sp.]
MRVELQQTNLIRRVHWSYSLQLINSKIENLHTSEERIRFIQNIIDAIETDNIIPLDCFVEAISHYDNQTKDGIKDCLQRKMNNLYKVLSIDDPSRINKSKERIHEDQITEKDVKWIPKITEEELKDYFMPVVYQSIAPGKKLKNGQETSLFNLLIEEINEYIITPGKPSIYASAVAAKIFSKKMLIDEKVNSFKKWQEIFGDYLGLNLKYKRNQTEGYGEFTALFTSLN